ncbi:MAG: DUF58 domain-containing protein [Lachnospiraceae bacterium]|nr:DUF58 domain-containing protein [Lachnospiraceae bacterium]
MAIRRIMYIIFLLATIWIFIVYVDYSALQLFVSMIIIPAILDIMAFIASRNVIAGLELKDIYVVKKKSVQLIVKVANPSILPFIGAMVEIEMKDGFGGNTVNKKLKLNISDREINKFYLDMTPEYCGRIDISIKKFKLYDFTGIWSFKGKIDKMVQLYVLPLNNEEQINVIPRNNEYIEEPVKFSDNEPGDDCSQVFDIREFREGDRLQRIHWQLSAKKDETYVKEFSMPIDASAEILLELAFSSNNEVLRNVDAIIEKAYGLSVAFLEQEIYHYISWYDCKRGEIVRRDVTSADDIWNILYEIYHTSLYEDVAALQLYDGISYGNGVYLFYITTDENTVVKYEPHKIYVVGEI